MRCETCVSWEPFLERHGLCRKLSENWGASDVEIISIETGELEDTRVETVADFFCAFYRMREGLL